MAQTLDKLEQIHINRKGSAPIAAPGWTARQAEGVKLVDCDIHHSFRQPEDLLPYLPKFYQEHLLDQGLHLPGSGYANSPYRRTRPDLKDPELKDREFNYSLEFTQKELLDRWNIDIALLTGPPTFYALRGPARSRLGGRPLHGIQRLHNRALAGSRPAGRQRHSARAQ